MKIRVGDLRKDLRRAINEARLEEAAMKPGQALKVIDDFLFGEERGSAVAVGDAVDTLIQAMPDKEDDIYELERFITLRMEDEFHDQAVSDANQILKSLGTLAKTAKKQRGPFTGIAERQVRAIYDSAKRAYDESYAMMIDDAFSGAQRVATKYGVEVLYDVDWFKAMFRFIKAHKRWEDLSTQAKIDLVQSINTREKYK